MYTICVMVKDKRIIFLYAKISCDQPLFTLFSQLGRFYEDFTLSFTLSLTIPFTSHSLSLSLAYLMDVFVLVILQLHKFFSSQSMWKIKDLPPILNLLCVSLYFLNIYVMFITMIYKKIRSYCNCFLSNFYKRTTSNHF